MYLFVYLFSLQYKGKRGTPKRKFMNVMKMDIQTKGVADGEDR